MSSPFGNIGDKKSQQQLKSSASLRALLKTAEKLSLHKLKHEKTQHIEQVTDIKPTKTRVRETHHDQQHQRAQKLRKHVTKGAYDKLQTLFSKFETQRTTV